jgi:hypothetical protein
MYRVIYVDVERQKRPDLFGRLTGAREPLRETRQRLAEEMERIGEEMLRRGMRLIGVTPIVHGESLAPIETEAVWMHFQGDPPRSPVPAAPDEPANRPAVTPTRPAGTD